MARMPYQIYFSLMSNICPGKGRCNLNKGLRKGYRKEIIDEDYFISVGKITIDDKSLYLGADKDEIIRLLGEPEMIQEQYGGGTWRHFDTPYLWGVGF